MALDGSLVMGSTCPVLSAGQIRTALIILEEHREAPVAGDDCGENHAGILMTARAVGLLHLQREWNHDLQLAPQKQMDRNHGDIHEADSI